VSLQSLVETYGYLALFVGTFVEGETILILGGLAAHLGYLELPWVIVAAFAGSLLGDQLYFLIGRYRGRAYLAERPAWQSRSQRVEALLHRHQLSIILGFRFLYGLRTMTPFVIGVSGVPLRRFIVLNALGALIWASSFGTLGFIFGHGFEVLIGEIKHYEIEVMAGIVLLGLALRGAQRLRRRRKQGR
jgi:membrane protein DedA with SNARE-associated domain